MIGYRDCKSILSHVCYSLCSFILKYSLLWQHFFDHCWGVLWDIFGVTYCGVYTIYRKLSVLSFTVGACGFSSFVGYFYLFYLVYEDYRLCHLCGSAWLFRWFCTWQTVHCSFCSHLLMFWILLIFIPLLLKIHVILFSTFHDGLEKVLTVPPFFIWPTDIWRIRSHTRTSIGSTFSTVFSSVS